MDEDEAYPFAQSDSGRGSAVISEARAERLAALVVAAVEGAIVLSRAERHPGRGSRSAAELEGVIVSAPALVH